MNFDLINEWFYCDSTSPTGLRWKKSRYSGNNKQIISANKHSIAGGKNLDGYSVRLGKNRYKAHRVVWLLCHGLISDDLVIDHINGNPFDNEIKNLRLVERKLNSRNLKKNINNKSGHSGVSLSVTRNEYHWRAQWYENRKKKSKSFSVNKYGNELANLLAVEYRDKMIRLLNLKNYNYSERHGK